MNLQAFVYAEILKNRVVTNLIGGVYTDSDDCKDWSTFFYNVITTIAQNNNVSQDVVCIKTFTPLPSIAVPSNTEMYLADEE